MKNNFKFCLLIIIPIFIFTSNALARRLPRSPGHTFMSETSELQVGRSNLIMDGNIRADATDRIDVDENLDMGKDKTPALGLRWQLGKNFTLRSSLAEHSFSGKNTLDVQIEFAGQTFDTTVEVSSELDFSFMGADLNYHLQEPQPNRFKNVFVGLRGINFTGQIEAIDSDTVASKSIKGGVPVVGFELRRPVGILGKNTFIEARGAKVSLKYNSMDFNLHDWNVALGYRLSRNTMIKAGRREYKVEIEDTESNDELDLNFSGVNAHLVWMF